MMQQVFLFLFLCLFSIFVVVLFAFCFIFVLEPVLFGSCSAWAAQNLERNTDIHPSREAYVFRSFAVACGAMPVLEEMLDHHL